MKNDIINKKHRMIALQLICWGVILATTLFWSFGSNGNNFDAFAIAQLSINIATFIIIYLLNYLIIIPRFLFCNKRGGYFVANLIVIALLLCVSFGINNYGLLDSLKPEGMPPRPLGGQIYLIRDLINFILMIGLVTAMRLADRLEMSETALREAESARIKAELANLRSQINPHFLLNTLNNIYALTAIDTDKAQKTIKELSDLLRYILYDNLNERVSLKGEVKFLKSYIELMSIRLPRKVLVTTEFRVSEGCTTQIAPLIFISLIENAFKHSVSASGQGFIDIHFEDDAQQGQVILSIKNSNHAKAEQDKSGHGIGLEQVRRRLELLYPNSHWWQVSSNKDVYTSKLILKTTTRHEA
ncbi:MAG: sensor histidine kinase [Rikenellaceae bacterium]